MSACSLSFLMRSTNLSALWHCSWQQQMNATRSCPFAWPLSFVRPMTNSSGETAPLLSASMTSKSISASSHSIPRRCSWSTIFGVASISLNSLSPNSPFPSRSASWNSSPIAFMMFVSVTSTTLLLLVVVASMISCRCSTITAMTRFAVPKVHTTMATIRSATDNGLTLRRGRATSLAQRSSVTTCVSVHSDFQGFPKYCSESCHCSCTSSVSVTAVDMDTATLYITRATRNVTHTTARNDSRMLWMIIQRPWKNLKPRITRTTRSKRRARSVEASFGPAAP
mmetsp:Transcript_17489/g.41068  ORF Transcript_17489/g.41068 Transcript_17489/m.41068 type:complete len:282 (+) Transcript_17489:267-1112(+)